VEKARLARLAGQAGESPILFGLQLKAPRKETVTAESAPDPIPRPPPTTTDGGLATLNRRRHGAELCWPDELLSQRASGRANAAHNLLHMGWNLLLQSLDGLHHRAMATTAIPSKLTTDTRPRSEAASA
jgi:hypothetical protein